MYLNKSFLSIIPARGGSKRLPGKNMLPLMGRPLIEWTIQAALSSGFVDTTCVSTDDERIAEISRRVGAEVPFLRPSELATDTASSISVVKHCVDFYNTKLNRTYDYVILLQPTSPLRKVSDIDSAIKFLFEKKADAVVSVCEADHSPLRCNILPDSLSMENFISDKHRGKRSQDLPVFYRINGAIYIAKTDRLILEGSFLFKKNVFAYIMPRERSIDIDTEVDFKIAEILNN
ncbi:MAG: cytidylyltransferase domain-containing protein [Spirochaetota bacterium]